MDETNLRTASLYINNLLLSRGLLKNGTHISFSSPSQSEGGTDATMSRIITLVNDLILRRDRDATQRESLSNTLRAVRADCVKQTKEIEELKTKLAEQTRKYNVKEAEERALRMQLKGAEAASRGVREEMGRMRGLVAQTRSQCAVEVRKRERIIEGLKKHVGEGGRPRGSGKGVGVATITVVPGVGAAEIGGSASMQDDNYDLRTETNEFLTELARGLSEDNEALGALMRRTVESLKALSGWEKEGEHQQDGLIVSGEEGYEAVAAEADNVIEHLRTLLTNPSFVPLEEVEVRDEEIERLRNGWEKMEARWKDAVKLMDGWRKRLSRTGQTINLEELKMGMRLSPVKEYGDEEAEDTEDLEEAYEEGETQADIDAMNDSQVPGADYGDGLGNISEASEFDEEDDNVLDDQIDDRIPDAEDTENEYDSDGFLVDKDEQEEEEVDWLHVDDNAGAVVEAEPVPEPEQPANRRSKRKSDTTLENNSAKKRALSNPKLPSPVSAPAEPKPEPKAARESTRKSMRSSRMAPPPRPSAPTPRRSIRSRAPEPPAVIEREKSPSPVPAPPQISPLKSSRGCEKPARSTRRSNGNTAVEAKPNEKQEKQEKPIPVITGKPRRKSEKNFTTIVEESTMNVRRFKDSGHAPEADTVLAALSPVKNFNPTRSTLSMNSPIFPESLSKVATEFNNKFTESKTSRTAPPTTLEPPQLKSSKSSRRKKDDKPWDENLVLSPIKPTVPTTTTSSTLSKPDTTSTSTSKPQLTRKGLMDPPALPKPKDNVPPQQSPLTMDKIAAKLAATEREADAARVRAKLRAMKAARSANPLTSTSTTTVAASSSTKENRAEEGDMDVAVEGRKSIKVPTKTGEEEGPRKRDKVQRSSRTRRRSTLSPWELESLILGGVQPSPAK